MQESHVNTNLWKIALPVVATVAAAAIGLWMQPRSQPPTLDDALARFAMPEGAAPCQPPEVGLAKTTGRSHSRGCAVSRR